MTAKLVKTEAVVEGRTEVRWTLVEEDDTPEFEEGSATHPIGDPTPRITARARTTGTARFTVDVALPGLLEAAVLRSPHANAKVTSLDLDAARAVPGVRCVLGPGDGPGNDDATLSDSPNFAGAAIAAVAADTADAAEAALAALAPTYEVLGFVSDIDEAFERQDFLVDPTEHERGDPDAALAAADVRVEATYIAPAQLHNSMEPHAAVADWREDGLTLWSSTQAIYDARATVAEAFELDPERVRVICEFMGGGFGSKFGVGPQGILATELSRQTGRPVRLVNSRREENLAAGFRTPARMEYTIGASRDGRLQAVEASAVMGMGTGGWAFPVLEPVKSVYTCPNLRLMVAPVRQNLGPSVAFRAPGVMEGTFGFEQALDELAEKLGIDPLELRRLNHSADDPENGKPYTSKRLLECYDRAAELAGWDGRDALRGDGRIRRGMGVSSQYWWGGGGPPAYAECGWAGPGQEASLRGIADPAARIVDDPIECAAVARVRDQSQVGEQVHDLAPLVEARATHDLVGEPVAQAGILQRTGLGVRTVEDHEIAQGALRIFLQSRPDLGDDPIRLIPLVGGRDLGQELTRPGVGAQQLPLAPGILGDHEIGRLQDSPGRAVVLLEADDGRVGEILLEVEEDVADIGASPAVDGLVIVAHDHEVRRSRAGRGMEAPPELTGRSTPTFPLPGCGGRRLVVAERGV